MVILYPVVLWESQKFTEGVENKRKMFVYYLQTPLARCFSLVITLIEFLEALLLL
jgi:hypothetical protein